MQTLKTAIVVMLMMTVMYGCYVSLTTAPEPLPPHIASLIDESTTFDSLAIEQGSPEDFSAAAADAGPMQSDFADLPASIDHSAIDLGQGPTGTEAIPASSRTPASAAIASLSDRGAAAETSTPLVLPQPGEATAVDASQLPGNYPDTLAGDGSLPDPNSLESLPPSGWKRDHPPAAEPAAAAADHADASSSLGLANAIQTADRQYAADQAADALATLSLFYNTPDLSDEQRHELLRRLDPLAAVVIYSRRHLLEQPHRVGETETLMEIAVRYDLPWQLLANINGIDDPVTVLPGTELKVLRGPFRAEVDLQRNELTLFLGELYAGRFPIAVGQSPAPAEGSFTIQDKQTERPFTDENGAVIEPGDPRNPYGSSWLDLGEQLCIHGSPNRDQATTGGCISLRDNDAADLYGILSQGSGVTIRR